MGWRRAWGGPGAGGAAAKAPGRHAAGRMGTAGGSDALVDGDEVAVFRTDVIGARADDLAVDALLDDVRAPARGARAHEQRGEHRGGHAHHVVADRTEPVQVRE